MINRRNLIKNTAKLAALAPVSVVAFTAWANDKKTGLIAESNPVAAALGYKHDATKAKRIKKGDAAPETQFCDNCQLYTKIDGTKGKCTMLQAGPVAAKGWCTSWIKKS